MSLLDDEAKIVTSRLGPRRFRIAGTAEFNGKALLTMPQPLPRLTPLGTAEFNGAMPRPLPCYHTPYHATPHSPYCLPYNAASPYHAAPF